MSVLIIGEDERRLIREAIERAKANPVSIETVLKGKIKNPGAEITLADRPPGFERPASEHVKLGPYLVAVSFERQPTGFCRHLSASVPTPGKVPSPAAMSVICQEFGFQTSFEPSKIVKSRGKIWLEEFEPGHNAVNVLELVEQ